MGTASRETGGRARRRLGVVLAGFALSLFAVPAAHAARSEFYGITQVPALDSQDIQEMATANLHTDRFPLAWSLIEPSKNTFQWAQTDQLVGTLASQGIRAAPFAWGSPGWAGTGGVQRPPASASARTSWQNFLKAAVGRYGPGGTYWASGGPYRQQFGPAAAPWPITSWQIWNEPNLKAFSPGSTSKQRAAKYGQLVQISQSAIKSKDSKAKVVLGGIATQNDPSAFDFLNSLYAVRRIKDSFDVAAIHPYSSSDAKIKTAIQRFRTVMKNRGDKATPLWITEFAWGSAAPDSVGINKGLQGQATALTKSYNMLLANRVAWNLQRVYWYLWRDPQVGSGCSFCGSSGLVTYGRTKKPAYDAFTAFTASPP